jgi:L-lysine exporter family protein LysE/ArgO
MFGLYFLQGFLIGLAYVAPIGTQNMYVINTALREKPYKTFRVH